MEVAGTAQVDVVDDGGGFFDGGSSEPIGEDRGDALVGESTDLERPRRGGFGPTGGEVSVEAQHAEASAEALFGMGPVGQDGDDQTLGVRADRGRPSTEAVGLPLGVAAMSARHLIGIGAVPTPAPSVLMGGDALAAQADLDGLGRGAGTINRGTPPKKPSMRTWAPVQSASVCVQVASAKVKPEPIAHRPH